MRTAKPPSSHACPPVSSSSWETKDRPEVLTDQCSPVSGRAKLKVARPGFVRRARFLGHASFDARLDEVCDTGRQPKQKARHRHAKGRSQLGEQVKAWEGRGAAIRVPVLAPGHAGTRVVSCRSVRLQAAAPGSASVDRLRQIGAPAAPESTPSRPTTPTWTRHVSWPLDPVDRMAQHARDVRSP
ncbi:hypothetical protein L1887_52872 [Cichorium endivia]|nr:hypothetical protein L1887_52872 [Cichorium endivia]